MEKVEHLKIPLDRIILATNNFNENNAIGKGGFGSVYKGELSWNGTFTTVAVKKLDPTSYQGQHEFLTEITTLSRCEHKNLVSLVGFCDEGNGNDKHKLLVYVHESRGSLDKYIPSLELTWMRRLKISIDAARALKYLHEEVGQQHRVLHRDIKSGNILLNDEWEAKVSDFGLSKIGLSNVPHTFVVTRPSGTPGYIDPVYHETGVLTKESDAYSFGVVLFEILCGRMAWLGGGAKHGHVSLGPLARRKYEEKKMDEIIVPDLRKQMKLASLDVFSTIAYQCLNLDRGKRPTMAQILEELEDAYALQVLDFAGVETSGSEASDMPLLTEKVEDFRIPLEDILQATNNFSNENLIGKGGFGSVYKGQLAWNGTVMSVAIKKLDPTFGQGDHEFLMEVKMILNYRHQNLVSLVGFCHEGKDKDILLVYAYASRGSLDRYIPSLDLTWVQRLKISIGAARGLNYLHHEVGLQHRVLHRDIKSANILLNDDWEAKVSDFGLSKIGPSNLQHSFLVTHSVGTFGYLDPVYYSSGVLTKESDVYSFGVVLFEILCGRLACIEGFDGDVFLGPLAERKYEEHNMDEIIVPNLRKQMKLNALNVFSKIAYQCLKANRIERPTMARIVEKLEHAYALQVSDE